MQKICPIECQMKECQKICQTECHKIRQKTRQKEYQKICQKECCNNVSIHAINVVRLKCHGGELEITRSKVMSFWLWILYNARTLQRPLNDGWREILYSGCAQKCGLMLGTCFLNSPHSSCRALTCTVHPVHLAWASSFSSRLLTNSAHSKIPPSLNLESHTLHHFLTPTCGSSSL